MTNKSDAAIVAVQTAPAETGASDLVVSNASAFLGAMPETVFEAKLSQMKAGLHRLRRIHAEVMTEEEDYGKIPGTNRPTLFKPGSEKILLLYGLVAVPVPEYLYGDGISEPHITVTVSTKIHVGSDTGPVIAVGVGACSTWEKKYRYRAGVRACPDCGAVGTLIKKRPFPDQRQQFTPGWLCFEKKGGCGSEFNLNDKRVVDQRLGDIENPDTYDLLNTILKMAKKRAQVDATLTGTAGSGQFSQDLDEDDDRSGTDKNKGKPPKAQGSPAGQAAQGAQGGQNRPPQGAPGRPQGQSSANSQPSQAPTQSGQGTTPTQAATNSQQKAQEAAAEGTTDAATLPKISAPLETMSDQALQAELITRAGELADQTKVNIKEIVARYSMRQELESGRRTMGDVSKASRAWLIYTVNNLRNNYAPTSGAASA